MGLNNDLRNHFDRRAGGIRLDPPALRDIRARARQRQRNQRLATGIAVLALIAGSIIGVRAIVDTGETPERIQVLDDSGSTDTPSGTDNGNGGGGTGVPPTENGGSETPGAAPNPEPEPTPTAEPPQTPEPEPTPTQTQQTEQTTTQTPEPEPTPTAEPPQAPEPEPTPTQTQQTEQTTTQTPEPEPTPTAEPPQAPEPEPTPIPEPVEPEPTATVQTPELTPTNCDYSYTDDDWYTIEGSDSTLIDFRNRDFRGCDMSGAQLAFSDFSGSNLSGANLSGATLQYSHIHNAIFVNSNLTNANLNGVQFNGSDFTGANLSGSSRIYASFLNATIAGCIDCIQTRPSSDPNQEQVPVEEIRTLSTPSVTCSKNGNNAVVSWDEVSGAAKYRVSLGLDRQRYLPGDVTFVTTSTSHEFIGLDWISNYDVFVHALRSPEDSNTNDSSRGTAICTTDVNPNGSPILQRLAAPSIDCSPGGDDFEASGTYDLSWAEIPGAAEYFITYQEEGDGVIISGGWQPHSTLRMDWAKPSTEYTISVQAFRDGSRTVIAAGEIGTANCSFDTEQ